MKCKIRWHFTKRKSITVMCGYFLTVSVNASATRKFVYHPPVCIHDLHWYMKPNVLLRRPGFTEAMLMKFPTCNVIHSLQIGNENKINIWWHTSSIKINGFWVLVFFRHCIILPGIAPTYVRLCPLISATSVIPPTLNLKYWRENKVFVGYVSKDCKYLFQQIVG